MKIEKMGDKEKHSKNSSGVVNKPVTQEWAMIQNMRKHGNVMRAEIKGYTKIFSLLVFTGNSSIWQERVAHRMSHDAMMSYTHTEPI